MINDNEKPKPHIEAVANPQAFSLRNSIREMSELILTAIELKDFGSVKVDITNGLSTLLIDAIEREPSPIFRKFLQKDGSINQQKVTNKIATYTSIHKNTLVRFVENALQPTNQNKEKGKTIETHEEQEIQAVESDVQKNETNEDTQEIQVKKKRIIREILLKYIRIVFTFGEKISPDQLEVLLGMESKTLSKINKTYSGRLSTLEETEKQVKGNIQETGTTPRMLENTYKTLFDDKESIERISDRIEKGEHSQESEQEIQAIINTLSLSKIQSLIKTALIYDFKMFAFILESEVDFLNGDKYSYSVNFLNQQIAKTKNTIKIFEKSGFDLNIGTSNFDQEFEPSENPELIALIESIPHISENVRTKEFGGRKKIDIFKQYLKLSGSVEFWETVKNIKEKEIKDRVPPPIDDVDLTTYDSKKINIDNWIQTPEAQKYEYIFTQIFADALTIQPENILKLNTQALELENVNDADIELYIRSTYKSEKKSDETEEERKQREEYDEAYIKRSVNIVRNQLYEIENISEQNQTTIDDLMRYNLNHVHVLVNWWRFVLKKRKLKQEGKQITLDALKQLPHDKVSYGFIQKVWKDLDKLLQEYTGKIDIKTGRPLNTSIRGIEKIAEEKHNALTREDIHIDARDIERVDSVNGNVEKVALKDISQTYIPPNIYAIKPENGKSGEGLYDQELRQMQIGAIRDWISTGIQTCRTLLKGKEPTNKQEIRYLDMLKEQGIAQGNIISENDKNKVQRFIAKLKFIQEKSHDLEQMFAVNDRDLDTIHRLLKASNKRSKTVTIRPQKEFTRAFDKFIKDHSANGSRLTDLGGGLAIQDSIHDTREVIKEQLQYMLENDEVTHVSIVDKIGEPLVFAQEISGYRDVKLLITLKNGNTIEYQLHINSMLDMKKDGPTQNELQTAIDEIKGEGMLLTFDEMKELVQFARRTNRKLPHQNALNLLLSEGKITHIHNIFQYNILSKNKPERENTIKEVSLDALYGVARNIDNPTVANKIKRFHRALADLSFGPVAADYIFETVRQK